MRVGVIGVGRIGRHHAAIVASHPDVDTVVVTDVDADRAHETALAVGGEVAPDAATLLDRVDAVMITSPTDMHARHILQAVEARRPTFCEKPVALDLESTMEVVRRVQDTGVTVQIGFQRRFDAGYRAARGLVVSGALGRMYMARIIGHDPAPPHEAYIPASGGIFRDLHIHDFDIVQWTLGQDIVEVYAKGTVLVDPIFKQYDDVDTVAAVLTFSGGTLGALTGGRHDPIGYDIRLELLGSGDSISVGWDANTPLRSVEPGMPGAPEHPHAFFADRFAGAFRAELNHWVEVVQGRATNPTTVMDAERALRVALACDRSRREGRAVVVGE
jgi:myo-inositol 2-dehydrogenase / D-chiro-inositol 1-dehydrogenase